MTVMLLNPQLDLLKKDYVLIQACKKASSYIRNHNWYSDTLELDRVAFDLPYLLGEIKERLKTPVQWCSAPLRIVPAPGVATRINASSRSICRSSGLSCSKAIRITRLSPK